MHHYKTGGVSQKALCKETETKINDVIVKKLAIEQVYTNLASLCALEKVNLINFTEYFRLCGLRARLHADKLITEQGMRNGELRFQVINNFLRLPSHEEMNFQATVKDLVMIAIEGEKIVQRELEGLLRVADETQERGIKERVSGLLLPGQHCIISQHMRHLQILDTIKREIEQNGEQRCQEADTRLIAEWKFDRVVMPEIVENMHRHIRNMVIGQEGLCSARF